MCLALLRIDVCFTVVKHMFFSLFCAAQKLAFSFKYRRRTDLALSKQTKANPKYQRKVKDQLLLSIDVKR